VADDSSVLRTLSDERTWWSATDRVTVDPAAAEAASVVVAAV
jgi:hypothetical protein